MIHDSAALVSDRRTAQILGALLLVLTVLIDASAFLFYPAEVRSSARFAVVVLVSSVPWFALGVYLLRRSARFASDEDGSF